MIKKLSICNYIGPEHIEILLKNFKKYLNKNIIAGSVCIGPYSSMALSDYGPTTAHFQRFRQQNFLQV